MATIVNERPSSAEDQVDPSALVVPFEQDLPHVDLYQAALLLDGALRRLSVVRGAVERQVGRRLLAMKRLGGFKKLGFSDEADYMNERTELSLRSGQEMMRVARKCQELPLIRRAIDERVISASQARVLVRVAEAGNEAAWIEKARGLSVRGLAAEVRRAIAEARSGGQGASAPAGGDGTAEDDEEAEAVERISFAAPEWLVVKWRLAQIHYRLHPQREAAVRVLGRHQSGPEYLLIELPDGAHRVLPSWMLDPIACSAMTEEAQPQVGLQALRLLRTLVDAQPAEATRIGSPSSADGGGNESPRSAIEAAFQDGPRADASEGNPGKLF